MFLRGIILIMRRVYLLKESGYLPSLFLYPGVIIGNIIFVLPHEIRHRNVGVLGAQLLRQFTENVLLEIPLVKQLKKLQDNLGDFNDYVVQGEYLIQILQDLSLEGEQARLALASIGGLVGHLDEEKARVQGEFAQTFRDFAARENQKRFKMLFKDDNGGVK